MIISTESVDNNLETFATDLPRSLLITFIRNFQELKMSSLLSECLQMIAIEIPSPRDTPGITIGLGFNAGSSPQQHTQCASLLGLDFSLCKKVGESVPLRQSGIAQRPFDVPWTLSFGHADMEAVRVLDCLFKFEAYLSWLKPEAIPTVEFTRNDSDVKSVKMVNFFLKLKFLRFILFEEVHASWP